jgi:hypothetical protein
MTDNRASLFFPACLFLAGALAVAGQTKTVAPAQQPRPPVAQRKCADVAIVSFTVRLVSTQVGDASVEFPQDTVRLEAILANIGTLDISRSIRYHVELTRNSEVVYQRDLNELLSGPGSRWTFRQVDTFPHNLKTTYTLSVTVPIDECRKDNNQATLTIDEKKLHPVKVNLAPKAAVKPLIKRP